MEHFITKEFIKTRETTWKTIESQVEQKADKLGKGIEDGIKPVVIGLKANGFGTTGSCEGHLDRAFPYPWVDVESIMAERLLNNQRYLYLCEKARVFSREKPNMTPSEIKEYKHYVESQIEENEKASQKLALLLEEFYKTNPQVKSEVRLAIIKFPWKQSRLQPKGIPSLKVKELQQYWTEEEKKRNIALYRQEMERFSQFLRQRFFSKN